MPSPHRILLKLSGEQFAGKNAFGIDTDFLLDLARELHEVVTETKVQIVIVVGGGNFLRGAALSKNEATIERATADYMGMLATVMNGMALVDILEHFGQPARLQTRIRIDSVAEPFIRRRAIRHLEKGRIVVIGGGTGNPYVTTDTAAVSTALELGCDIVLKATKVDGVYSQDPNKHSDAVKITQMSHLDVIKDENISVMDNAAISLAMDNKLPLRIFELLTKGNIKRIANGEEVGTLVK
ncbi:MAG: UMP kinase [Candidatus Yonathbacteria bacterium RIFCSPHIGHO2_01_FULL_44_41]|uniref:Uridylate kinase n=1 Tax=Candidatus Yonathbacteria bacterium RIFCSPHIGHO2_02_FULL_44_14 TaxID=1802724 RepID=A0A1G2S629_9BACT|nr:MAG: UMP kinase [Candidatus Yonathbacteria bacterium RIFCSPHIGHO2_01_FULL_44_41]OHA80555.1 MAG: UMP kinase [Candidatus Yonathbacteria bacterium RIFCSPHIGHO2_02_FULL_44_14]OHA82153.1 MAG: UMP kinase [Candidatus Yonathbacteria bacterium RIFCSPLOWO2_01_FULL_43_20]